MYKYQVIITKEVKSGILSGMILQDKYRSCIKDKRVVGYVYQGITHKYKVLKIEHINIK